MASSNIEQTLPAFTRSNYWNVENLRDYNQEQRPFVNDQNALYANVQYFGINTSSQSNNHALGQPYDSPAYTRCQNGPMRMGGRDWCVTNVVSRPVESCHSVQSIKSTQPVCAGNLRPYVVGCAVDNKGNHRAQWQCLPGEYSSQLVALGQEFV